MKKSIAAVLFRGSIGLALVLMAAGCGFPGFGPSLQSAATGSLNLTITTDSASRTIAPATADCGGPRAIVGPHERDRDAGVLERGRVEPVVDVDHDNAGSEGPLEHGHERL